MGWRALICHIFLSVPIRLVQFQQHKVYNEKSLDVVGIERTAAKQASSSVLIPRVLSDNCARHDTLLTVNICWPWWKRCGFRYVHHRRHGCQRIARIQLCAVYHYCSTWAQELEIGYNCKLAQKVVFLTLQLMLQGCRKRRGLLDDSEVAESLRLSLEK